MKHVVSPILLLVFLLVFCLLSACFVSETVEQTTTHMNTAIDLWKCGDNELALKYLKDAANHWDKCQKFCGIVLKHDDLDHISSEFERIHSYANTSDPDDFLSNCAAMLAVLEHVRDMEWPYLENIL